MPLSPPGILEKAKAHASVLLGQAGLRVVWAECRYREEDAPTDSACQLPLTPLDLEIRIINRKMANRLGTSTHRLGYVWLTPGLDSIAAVYFHRAVELEHDHGLNRALVAFAISHKLT